MQNHTIERLWVEVNKRINYPIKRILAEVTQNGEICMDDPLYRFCCSWLTLHLSVLKGARYLLIIHEVLVAMDLFSAGVQDETLEEESQRLAS